MPERILLSAAGPYGQVGKLSLESPSEVLDADSLGRVVPRQHQIEALGLGGQAAVQGGVLDLPFVAELEVAHAQLVYEDLGHGGDVILGCRGRRCGVM